MIFVALFLSPIVLGIFSAKLSQTDLLAKLLRRLGFRTVNYIRSAWDWHFSRQEPLWAVVTLRDGAVVYGYFGANSFAGDDPRDIYMEKVFKLEDNQFRSTAGNCGALIMADQIAAIEFYKENGGEQ